MNQSSISLKQFNTFGVEATANNFVQVHSEQELQNWIKQNNACDKPLCHEELFVLGGGSNLLLLDHINKTFLQADILGICYQEKDDEVLVTAGAGVNWHQLVLDSLEQGYSGLENLSLIPGNVGASPIQNIGAYGVELKDLFVELRAVNLQTGQVKTFNHADCQFAYRDSIFKNQLRGQYVISFVTLRLQKASQELQLDYGAIQQELSELDNPTAQDVSNAVVRIRSSKLPDPQVLGNAGSFFKNPVVSCEQFDSLKDQYPNMVAYPISQFEVKLAAGWLIEHAGLKGYRQGDAGVHDKQALVLVNHGKATGRQLLELAKHVQQTVFNKFAVTLEPEVWIIGEQDLF